MRSHAVSSGKHLLHGMSVSEDMKTVSIYGIPVHWSAKAERRVAETLLFLLRINRPPESMLKATDRIVFCNQGNKDDVNWRKIYSNFSGSAATGGDGTTVIYKGKGIAASHIFHEMGHNFAYKKWGTMNPGSRYAWAQRLEPPVTEYGKNSPSEEFAEACKLYATDSHSRGSLKRDFPKKFNVLSGLLGEMDVK